MSFELLNITRPVPKDRKLPKAQISLMQSGLYINNLMIEKIMQHLKFEPTYVQIYLDHEKHQVGLCFSNKKEYQSHKVQVKKQKNGISWYMTYNKIARSKIIDILNTTKIDDFDYQIINHKMFFILKRKV